VSALAEKIAAALPAHSMLSLDVKNISSLTASDAGKVHQAVLAELTRRGLRLDPTTGEKTHVEITLSESVSGRLWIAEIRNGEMQQIPIAIVRIASLPPARGPEPVLVRKIMWQQSQLLLDFDEVWLNDAESMLVVLGHDDLTVKKLGAGIVESQGTQPTSEFYPTRDLRGTVVTADSNEVQVYIEGVNCKATRNTGLHISCDSLAPLLPGEESFAARRNYHAGGATGWSGFPAWIPDSFSMVFFPLESHGKEVAIRLQTELDERTRMYDRLAPLDVTPRRSGHVVIDHALHPVAVFTGWGDDITAIRSGCGPAWQVLVTGTGDWTQQDHIQIYEITDHQAIAVGQPLDFPGPILALWPAEDGKSARVVSRNLQTGMYEASIVSVTCGN